MHIMWPTSHDFWAPLPLNWRLHMLGDRQPSIGPFGEQLSPKRARVAKRPMTFSYALTEVRGDWKWHRELWCLKRHYKCKDICHSCFANIYAGPTQYFVCKHITKEYMYIYMCVWPHVCNTKVYPVWGDAELSQDDCSTMVSAQPQGLHQSFMCLLALDSMMWH